MKVDRTPILSVDARTTSVTLAASAQSIAKRLICAAFAVVALMPAARAASLALTDYYIYLSIAGTHGSSGAAGEWLST